MCTGIHLIFGFASGRCLHYTGNGVRTMPHRQLIHLPEETYDIVRGPRSPRSVLSRPDDHTLTAALLSSAKRTDARSVEYCWMPDAIRPARQIDVATSSSSVPLRLSKFFKRTSDDNLTEHPGALSLPNLRHRPDRQDKRTLNIEGDL